MGICIKHRSAKKQEKVNLPPKLVERTHHRTEIKTKKRQEDLLESLRSSHESHVTRGGKKMSSFKICFPPAQYVTFPVFILLIYIYFSRIRSTYQCRRFRKSKKYVFIEYEEREAQQFETSCNTCYLPTGSTELRTN